VGGGVGVFGGASGGGGGGGGELPKLPLGTALLPADKSCWTS